MFFNIVTVDAAEPNEDLVSLFERAIRQFRKEYEPASSVKITHVNQTGVTYYPESATLQYTFAVYWTENFNIT